MSLNGNAAGHAGTTPHEAGDAAFRSGLSYRWVDLSEFKLIGPQLPRIGPQLPQRERPAASLTDEQIFAKFCGAFLASSKASYGGRRKEGIKIVAQLYE